MWLVVADPTQGEHGLVVVSKRKQIMETIQESALSVKIRELCQAILEDPEVQSARQRVDDFMADEPARALYNEVMNKGNALQQKQERSQPLTGEEIASFERDRDALLRHPVARGYLEAQEQLHEVEHTVRQQVGKTLELGRLPSESDMESGGCGHGCGCHH
jgi:cell fate (sporulation/competence/biofilm development) regulator YlbF (YheA/YmcA/DUF963 family)